MLHFCPRCRNPDVEKPVVDSDSDHATAECPDCGERFRFPYLPLFTLEGAPAVGKSTAAGRLDGDVEPSLYEGDMHIDLTADALSWDAICGLDLRVCLALHSVGERALFVGGVHPHDLADSPETRYFSRIERCALVCDDADLEERLRAREMDPDAVETFLDVNRWYRESGPEAGLTVVNTSDDDPDEAAERVSAWIEARLESS